ncbi:unnamed protein product, partial [Hapterophycus canaliculatus]
MLIGRQEKSVLCRSACVASLRKIRTKKRGPVAFRLCCRCRPELEGGKMKNCWTDIFAGDGHLSIANRNSRRWCQYSTVFSCVWLLGEAVYADKVIPLQVSLVCRLFALEAMIVKVFLG